MKFHILVVFIISGVCAGLAGVVSTARLGAAEPLAGMGFETYAIASAIIGGTSFFGGKGRIFVVIGGLIIGTINNGLNILQVQTYYQLVVMGGLIIAAVALDRLISKELNMKISPSLMCMDLLKFKEQIEFIDSHADYFHIDIMDTPVTLSPI